LARPPREEAKRRSGIPEWISLPRPEVRGTYTRIWRRRSGRGGCASRTPSLRVNYAARARLLLLAAIFFHLFYEVGETSACNLSRARPRRSRFAPMEMSHRSIGSKIKLDGNTLARGVFPRTVRGARCAVRGWDAIPANRA